MTYEHLTSSVAERICTITLNRPEVLNAITPTMLQELGQAVSRAAEADEVAVVVVTGAGRAFSAGVDLKALGQRSLSGGLVGDILDIPGRAATRAITDCPKPVIAKVNGACFTGALEIALACDLIVVAEEAKLGDTHAKWGLRPTWGMSARLPALVGLARARELSLTARTFLGREAHAMGLACTMAPRQDLDAAVGQLCEQLMANSAQSQAAYKVLYSTPELEAALTREADTQFPITDTDERLADFRK